jgi:hypothetical protein
VEQWEIHDAIERMRMAVFVAICWMLAVIAPPMLAGFAPSPGIALWLPMALAFAYLGYSGMRARRKGWRSRFILRVVVPLALLATSSALTVVLYALTP